MHLWPAIRCMVDDPTTNIQFVVFYFMGKQYMMHKGCPLIVVFTQDTFPSSLRHSNVSLRWKHRKSKELGTCSLIHNILKG
jgi:hypothetical protein